MDLIPIVPAGRQLIERYGPSGFRVSGVICPGPVLVFPDRTVPWSAADAAAVSWESLLPVVEHGGVQILLLGLGRRNRIVDGELRTGLRAAGIVARADGDGRRLPHLQRAGRRGPPGRGGADAAALIVGRRGRPRRAGSAREPAVPSGTNSSPPQFAT